MLMLLCAVTTWAGVTDLPEMSTDGDIKWYTIKNVRKQKFATYAGDNATMTQQASATAASFFYFTGSVADGVATVKIHNYSAGELLCAAYNSWTTDGIDWYIKAQATGVSICTSKDEWNAWNDAGGGGQKVEYWSASDAGSAWEISLVTDFTSIINVPAAKSAAIAEIENLATQSHIYPVATDYVASINAVEAASTGLADLNAAVEAVNAIVASYKATAYAALDGKYYTINTPARSNGYLQMSTSSVVATASAQTPANIWQFVANNDKVYIYNPYTGKYLCEPGNNSTSIGITTDLSAAAGYELTVNAGAENSDAKIKLTSNGKSVHVDGSSNLVRWDNGGASEYTIAEMTATDITAIANAYKTTLISTLDQWATLSVVFDATLIENAKAAINANSTTTYAAFAELDAELTNVTNAVAAKMFTFQTTATDAGRNGVWVSANVSAGKAIGADTQDYNAIWSLRHAGGTAFYMYNELNKVYMGNPGGQCALSATPTDSYTFEIIDATHNIVEMKCNGGTLHASNWDSNALINYDGNEAASRWYIRTIDVAADIQTILDGLTENDYAEVPALGQYPTDAYNALVAARTNAKTVEEVEQAIAAFNKSKNVPVYFITSAWDDGYPAGKAILYNGSAWRFDTADKYNKQMWMTIPSYTNADVPVVDAYDANGTSYAICDYLTNTVMRGKQVQIVKIEGWDGAYNLQYNANAESTDAAHHAQSGGNLVNWKPATSSDCQASAWKVEYIGSSYELDQLTDDKLEALSALKTAYNAKNVFKDYTVGNAVGQYSGDKEAIVAALESAEVFLNATLVNQATAADVDAINAATTALNNVGTLEINLPISGRYYRIAYNFNGTLKYVQAQASGAQDKANAMLMSEEKGAASIFYFADGKLLSYTAGLYVKEEGGTRGLQANGAGAVEFEAGSTVGTIAVKAPNYMHANSQADGLCFIDHCGGAGHDAHNFIIEEVESLPVTITAAGYATFYAPVEVSFEGVEAYYTTGATVENHDAYLQMVAFENNVIPAGEGAILKGEGDHELAINYDGTTESIEDNALTGTVAKTLISKEAGKSYYVLANHSENGVGLYNPINDENANEFYNAGHKAYMVVEGAAQTVGYSFSFDWNGTTGIENIDAAAEATNAVIYDITGRKINSITVPGIYIINGKKTFVK